MATFGRYRKRVITVDAYKVSAADAVSDWPEWLREKLADGQVEHGGRLGRWLVIATPEGVQCARDGDWVICGVGGVIYPCDKDIFGVLYERF